MDEIAESVNPPWVNSGELKALINPDGPNADDPVITQVLSGNTKKQEQEHIRREV